MTPDGAPFPVAAALGVLLLVAGGMFAIEALYVPGIALVALALGFTVWVFAAASGARVRRITGPPSVEEDAPWPVRIEFESGPLQVPGGEVRDPLLKHPVPVRGLRPHGGGPPSIGGEVRFARRGLRRLEPCEVVVHDPLRLASRTVTSGPGGEVLVLPKIHPVTSEGGGGAAGAGRVHGADGGDAAAAGQLTIAELELDILRPYRPGTPATRIHWPTLARTGQLMERRLIADDRARPLLVVDATAPTSPEALDAVVRAAASLAFHMAVAGGCAVLLPGDRHAIHLGPELRGWPAMHARLAVLEPSASDPRLDPRSGRRGSVVWVGARASGSWPALVGKTAYLVTPERLRDAPVAFSVAGCFGHALQPGAKRAAA